MSALSPRQMFLLDLACGPIADAFGKRSGVYLVGTAQAPRGKRVPRDVDVRLILSDKQHDKLTDAIGPGGVALLGLTMGQYLASLTGLPIDFQLQRQTEANHHHPGGMRNPLGVRGLINFEGDAPPVKP